MPLALITLLVLTASAWSQAVSASWQELPLEGGGALVYKLGLPDGFDAARSYPALLALPPGAQTREMVDASWVRYWGEQAGARGWIVVSPVAPEGRSFHDGAEELLPELIRHVHARFHVERDRLHLAGVSNGGRGAFRVSTRWPEAFLSLTVLPGYPPGPEDEARLGRLADLPVSLYVGGDDLHWVERTDATARQLRALGVDVTSTTLAGEGHTPPSLDGDVILERLEAIRAELALRERPPPAATTVFVVRHAEKRGQDGELSAAGVARAEALARLLEPTALVAVYASEYARTQQTVAPTAAAQGLDTRIVPARDELAPRLLREHAGESVLVAGHSNTVPVILRGLGVARVVQIPEDRYGDLFVVSIVDGAAQLVHLRY